MPSGNESDGWRLLTIDTQLEFGGPGRGDRMLLWAVVYVTGKFKNRSRSRVVFGYTAKNVDHATL